MMFLICKSKLVEHQHHKTWPSEAHFSYYLLCGVFDMIAIDIVLKIEAYGTQQEICTSASSA
jgi:hypothetical protein